MKLQTGQSTIELPENRFLQVDQLPQLDKTISLDSAQTTVISIKKRQDAFDALKQLEGSSIPESILQKYKLHVLEAQVDAYRSNKDERKRLEAELLSLQSEQSILGDKNESTGALIALRKQLVEELTNRPQVALSNEQIEILKQNKLQERIRTMLNGSKPSNVIPNVLKSLSPQNSSTWGEPVLSLGILQSLFLGVILLFNFDIRIIVVGVVAFILQIILALWANDQETKFLKFLSMIPQPQEDQYSEQMTSEEDTIVQYTINKAIQAEIDHIDETIKQYYDGKSSEEIHAINDEITSKIKEVELRLESLEVIGYPPEIYLQKRRELDILKMQDVSVGESSEEKYAIVVLHENPETELFAQEQNNLLQSLENLHVAYIASKPQFNV